MLMNPDGSATGHFNTGLDVVTYFSFLVLNLMSHDTAER
jgi:hypothetical protein